MIERKVYIIGAATTSFGEFFEKSASQLALESFYKAIENAEVKRDQVDYIFIGSMIPNDNKTSLGAYCASQCNIDSSFMHIHAGNASGAAALHQAFLSVLSGQSECIAVVGVEKLSDYVKNGTIEKLLGGVIDYTWEYEMGATLTSLYALLTKAHMKQYNTTLEQLATVPYKNHKNGTLNENAQYRREIPLERILSAKRISGPIGRFDVSTPCDGSTTLILASSSFLAKNEVNYKVPILASTQGTDRLALFHRTSLTQLKSTTIAAEKAYKMAGISPKDISLAEVHDAYPIGEILAIEDLKFFDKGLGGKATEEGETQINGKIAVNPSGGLKARGDPFGATGIAQVFELFQQMTQNAGKRQVNEAEYGLAQNVVGTGVQTFIHIIGRDEVKK